MTFCNTLPSQSESTNWLFLLEFSLPLIAVLVFQTREEEILPNSEVATPIPKLWHDFISRVADDDLHVQLHRLARPERHHLELPIRAHLHHRHLQRQQCDQPDGGLVPGVPQLHPHHLHGVLHSHHVPGSDRERDGAHSDIQDEGHAQQHEYFSSELECGWFDGAVGVHADGTGGGQLQAGDVGAGQGNV